MTVNHNIKQLEKKVSKERELIKDMKILLECTAMGGLQRNADVLIGRAIELLAQLEQEPVAWMYERQAGDFTARTLSVGFEENFDGITTPLYTSPPTREPLSDAEIYEIFSKNEWKKFIELARAIEKAHGIGE